MSSLKRPGGRRQTAQPPAARGQALVEYVLIVVLVVFAIIVILTLTGPAVGNVFSNAVYNLLNQTTTPRATLSETEFWKYVTAVASYTPQSRVFNTNTPSGATQVATMAPTSTPVSPTAGSPPPTNPPATQQPSATPPDSQKPYPFYDPADSAANWHFDFTNVINGTALWQVKWYNGATLGNWFGGPQVGTVDYLYWPQDIQFTWPASPKGGVTADNWAVQFAANLPLEKFLYQVQISVQGRARMFVGSDLVGGREVSNETAIFDYNVAAAGNFPTRIEFIDTGGPTSLQVVFNRLADKNTCGWRIQVNAAFHSESSAWIDGVGNYAVDSNCHLRLRGWISIPLTATPRLVFWERWALASNDDMYVGVRDYQSGNPWTWVLVNDASGGSNMNWRRRVFDLRNFGGVDFRGKWIELAFRLRSVDANVAEGWFLDDIAVENSNVNVYEIGWKDDIDDNLISPTNWLNECNWKRTTAQKVSGTHSWTDSIIGNYENGTDCSLQLNGVVNYPASGPDVVELFFQSKVTLTTATDTAWVEYAPEAQPNNWQPLAPFGSPHNWIARATSYNWQPVTVRLSSLKGTRFWLRFRLQADTDGNVADGWYIDDVEIRERVNSLLNIPFEEPFNNLSYWTVSGRWGLTTDNGTTAPPFKSSPSALTDSPGNTANYEVPSDTRAELVPQIRLTGSTRPVLTFWTYWKANTANLNVEITKDDGSTWESAPLWQRLTGGSGPDDVGVQLGWQRVKVDLSAYKTFDVRVRFRLNAASGASDDGWYIDDLRIAEDETDSYRLADGPRVESMDNPDAADLWYNGGKWAVSDENGRNNTAAWSDSPGGQYTKPSRNSLEYRLAVNLTGTQKPTLYFWTTYNMNNNDRLYVEVSKDNGFTWPDIVWDNSQASVSNWVNLGWHRIQIDLSPYKTDPPIRIRFRQQALNTSPAADGWFIDDFTLFDRQFTAALGQTYTDEFNDLSNWVVEGNWTAVPNTYSGWQYQPPSFVPVPATYGTVTTSNWIGDYWHIAPSNTTVWGSPPGSNVTFPTLPADIGNDTSVGEIAFDYAADTVNRPFNSGVSAWQEGSTANHEWYIMRWRRRYRVTQTAEYMMRLRFAGGARLFINGTLQTPRGDLAKPYRTIGATATNPWAIDPDERSHYYVVNLNAGTNYDLRVEYYHTTQAESGPGRVDFAIAERSSLARTSASGNYADKHRTSIIIDGYFTIPADRVGNVRYDERWSLTDEDLARVYFSLDGGFTWTEVVGVRRIKNNPQGGGWQAGSLQDWVDTSFIIFDPVSGGKFTTAQNEVAIKFELDSRVNVAVDDGWLIDNFQFFATESVVNQPPVSTTASTLTTTNNNGSWSPISFTPTVVDTPGDTHTFEIVDGPKRGWADVSPLGNQLTYLPPDEWTGTTTFTYRATDQGGLSVIGTATVTVEPYFYRGLNVGSNSTAPAVTINGNPFVGWNAGYSSQANSTAPACDTTMALIPPADTDTTTMLRCWRQWNLSGGHMRLGISGSDNPAVYSVYVYVIENSTTPSTYDIFGEDVTTRIRVVNDNNSVGRGVWKRLGPFVVMLPSGSTIVDVFLRGLSSSDVPKVAGIEMWRGGDYQGPGWMSSEFGGTSTLKGSVVINGPDSVTMLASGADIFGTSDAFRYTYRVEAQDVEMTTVTTFNFFGDPNPNQVAKAGLMFRANDNSNSANVSIFFRQDRRIMMQWRNSNGGSTSETSPFPAQVVPSNIGTPVWLKLSKVGNNITGSYSLDGNNWVTVGTRTVALGDFFLVGTALTSRTNSFTAQATFDDITITQQ